MNVIALQWIRLLKTILMLVLAYSLCRFLLMVNHSVQFDLSGPADAAVLMFKGLRFDLAAILTTNLPWLILFLLPFARDRKGYFDHILFFWFMLSNGFFLLLNVADIAYFPFIQTRMQFDAMRFVTGEKGPEFFNLLPRFISQYWYLWFSWLMMVVLLARIYRKIHLSEILIFPDRRTVILSGLMSLPAAALIVIGIRGGLQVRPLSIIHASEMTTAVNIPLILNSPFSVLTTYDKTSLPEWNFLPPNEFDQCTELRFKPDQGKVFQKRNIVLIIVESLSRNHLGFISGRSNTPFLDSLLAQSLYFDRAFANARVSIEGVPAIIASIPSWQDNPFIFSPYSTNRIQSFATVLKPHGYKTSFFHGGSAGTMGFNYFCALAGIENYYGREEYPLETDYDGSWGIWDEPFLQYMASELDHTTQPFATAVFTLNPHDPFRIPEKYRAQFKQPGHPIETSIRYTDYALEEFFRSAQKSDWYQNTLFIITADHTAPITEDKRFPAVDEYRIPIAFFLPDSSLRGSSDQIAEQIDILPSILDLLGYPDSCFNFGRSLFRNDCSRSSVNYRNGLFQYIDSAYCYQFNGKSAVALYQWTKDSFFTNNLIWNGQNEKLRMEKDKALKRRLQRFNQALIRNQMH